MGAVVVIAVILVGASFAPVIAMVSKPRKSLREWWNG